MHINQRKMLQQASKIYTMMDTAVPSPEYDQYKLLVTTKLDHVTTTLLSVVYISEAYCPDSIEAMRRWVCEILAYGESLKQTAAAELVDRILEVEDSLHQLCAEFLFRGQIHTLPGGEAVACGSL